MSELCAYIIIFQIGPNWIWRPGHDQFFFECFELSVYYWKSTIFSDMGRSLVTVSWINLNVWVNPKKKVEYDLEALKVIFENYLKFPCEFPTICDIND